jgi:hypothetical protein
MMSEYGPGQSGSHISNYAKQMSPREKAVDFQQYESHEREGGREGGWQTGRLEGTDAVQRI